MIMTLRRCPFFQFKLTLYGTLDWLVFGLGCFILPCQRCLVFAWSFLVLIGLQHANQTYSSNTSTGKFFPTHQVPSKTIFINPEENVLLVGIKPYLGREIINGKRAFAPA